MSNLDELSRLVALRDAGALNDVEFEIEKRKLGVGQPQVEQSNPSNVPKPRRRRWPLVLLTVVVTIIVTLLLINFVSISSADQTVSQNVEAADGVAGEGDGATGNTTYAERDYSPEHKQLIDQARAAWAEVRSGEGDTGRAYDRHTALLAQLFDRGICWGIEGQTVAQYDYHRCQDDSIQLRKPDADHPYGGR